MLNGSLIFWELTTFVVLLACILLFFRPWVREIARDRDLADQKSAPSAREKLDHRYASGELTQEEYLAIKNDITRE